MRCTSCEKRICRGAESCGREWFSREEVLDQYSQADKQRRVQASAELVERMVIRARQ